MAAKQPHALPSSWAGHRGSAGPRPKPWPPMAAVSPSPTATPTAPAPARTNSVIPTPPRRSTSPTKVRSRRCSTQTGPVDVVVNCAGISNFGLITEMAVKDFRDVVDVCLNGAFIVAKHAGQRLGKGGVLVSISSLNGRQPGAGLSAYCAAKAGLSMLTQVAALELGPRGIRVNAVAPGFVPTPLTEGAALVPGVVEDYVENTALGRAGTPEDVADAVVFLCSPKASWLTGEVLDLNGGAHLKRYPDVLGHVMKLASQ